MAESAEHAPEEKSRCQICNKVLSRQQRLKSHIETVHGLRGCSTKKYKQYLFDSSIPVPRSTHYHKATKKKDDLVQTNKKHQETSVCFEYEDEDPTAIPLSCTDRPLDIPDAVAHSSVEESDNVDLTDIEIEVDSQCDTSLDSVSCSDSESEIDTPRHPTIPLQEEKYMALLSYMTRHKLSGKASHDLLTLVKLFAKNDDLTNIGLSELKKSVGSCAINILEFCTQCFQFFPLNPDEYNCKTQDCTGLRYKGVLDKQPQKKKNAYFACLSVGDQLKSVLERGGVWAALQRHRRASCLSSNITDIINGDIYKDLCKHGNFLSFENNISLMFNTDGVPLYKSSKVNIWPVYLVINELPPVMRFSKKNMILWGIWQAPGKPRFTTYFQPFAKHMQDLKNEGIVITISEPICVKALLLLGTLDLQAKAYLADMSQHNGMYGCISCMEPGVVLPQGKGFTRTYPFRAQPVAERTTQDILKCGIEASEKGSSVQGVKGVSALLGMEWFDMVSGLVPDYMHGVLLGVTKKLLQLWFAPSNSRKEYFIGHYIKEIDQCLMCMKPIDLITRLPRKLESNINHLKASELQTWLIFYSLPCLIGFMDAKYLSHFALLVEGIYILLGDNIDEARLQRADYALCMFYKDFADLYGQSNCTINLHNTGKHLASYVRKFGPLWAWSCFPFEDMNGTLLNSVHGTGDVCMQALWTLQAQKRLCVDVAYMSASPFKPFTLQMTSTARKIKVTKEAENCKIVGGISNVTLSDCVEWKVKAALNMPRDSSVGNISKVLRVSIGDNVIYSKQYTRITKRIGYYVLHNNEQQSQIAEVQYFLYHHNSNMCLAVIKPITVCPTQPTIHHFVSHLICIANIDSEAQVINVNHIREKLMYLGGNKSLRCVARMQNLFAQCS